MIRDVASYFGTTTELLLWKKDRPKFLEQAGVWKLRERFYREYAVGTFDQAEADETDITPILLPIAEKDPDLRLYPTVKPTYEAALDKLAEEGFIDLRGGEAFIKPLNREEVEDTSMYVAVLTNAVSSTLAWLNNQDNPEFFFDEWEARINELRHVMDRGLSSHNAHHHILEWIARTRNHATVLRGVLQTHGQSFRQWRVWLKVVVKCGVIHTCVGYRDQIRKYNEKRLEFHDSLFQCCKVVVAGGEVPESTYRPLIERRASLVRELLALTETYRSRVAAAEGPAMNKTSE